MKNSFLEFTLFICARKKALCKSVSNAGASSLYKIACTSNANGTEADAMDAAGLDSSYARQKVRDWQSTQRDFIDQTGLRRDYFRERSGKQNLENTAKHGTITLDKSGRTAFSKMDYEDLERNNIQASNLAVRAWYVRHVQEIQHMLDSSLSGEQRARSAYELQNQYRTQARLLTSDRTLAAKLDATARNKTFDEPVESKMERKNMTRDQAIEDVYKTATTTNAGVNAEFGLE